MPKDIENALAKGGLFGPNSDPTSFPSHRDQYIRPVAVVWDARAPTWLHWAHVPRDTALDGLSEGRKLGLCSPPQDLIVRFARLANAGPEQVVSFMEKWGALMICKHGLPCTHRVDAAPYPVAFPEDYECGPRPANTRFTPPRVDGGVHLAWRREPLAAWLAYASQVDAIMRVCASLAQGDVPHREMLIKAGSPERAEENRDPEDALPERITRKRAYTILSQAVHQWLELGAVRLTCLIREDGPRVWATGRCLFGVLAVQLMRLTTQTRGLAVCSGCSSFYVPKSRVRRDRNNYCGECGRATSNRDAQRRYRERRRQRQDEEGSK